MKIIREIEFYVLYFFYFILHITMFVLKWLAVFFTTLSLTHCDNYTTVGINETKSTGNTSHDYTKSFHFILNPKRKAVLVVDPGANDTDINILRTKNSNKNNLPHVLQYQEYDADGTKLNDLYLKNLRDVANFFSSYLNISVCEGGCSAAMLKQFNIIKS